MDDLGPAFGDRLKRYVAREIADAIRQDDEVRGLFGPLIGAAWFDDPGADPAAPLRALRDLGAAITERPSLLKQGGFRALDMLRAAGEVVDDLPIGEFTDSDVTVIFTDLEGFTSFTADQGDEKASRLLRSHYSMVDDIVGGRGGEVVKRFGDGHMATFPRPRAAVLASLELVRAAPEPLRMRAGGHLGRVTRIESDIVGNTVNLASRVAGSAAGGSARVTLPVRDVAGDVEGVVFGAPHVIGLKGIGESISVCDLTAA